MDARGQSPAPRRRRPTSAVYQRRRLVALGAAVAVAAAVVLSVRGGGDSMSVRDVVRAQREAEPVRFTIEASGDLLIHSLVWERALALGGDDYDFAPLFEAIRPYVAQADLALCHVETPMTPAPPAS